MRTASLDANAITQPGGLYQSINDGLLQSLSAYFQHRDRQQAGERQLQRDERANARAQLAQALGLAERYGVAPAQEDTGWLRPEDDAAIQAAIGAHQERKKKQAEADWRQALSEIEAGTRDPEQTQEQFYAEGLREPPPSLLQAWDAQQRGQRSRAAQAERDAVKADLLAAQTALMEQKAFGRLGTAGTRGETPSAGELTALRERVQRYVDAQGWAVYDYDENGKPINRRVNPNIPDAYRKIMAAEAAAGLPGASEMLEFDAGMRPPAPSVGQGEAPATPAADADATGIDDDESGELPSLVREVGGEPLPLTEVGMGAAALNAGRDMPTTRGRITDAEIAAWFQRRATRQAARREADALRALR